MSCCPQPAFKCSKTCKQKGRERERGREPNSNGLIHYTLLHDHHHFRMLACWMDDISYGALASCLTGQKGDGSMQEQIRNLQSQLDGTLSDKANLRL